MAKKITEEDIKLIIKEETLKTIDEFFKSECVEDLTEKMIQMWNNPYEIKNIPEKYSFSKTAEKILSKIEENYSKNSRV